MVFGNTVDSLTFSQELRPVGARGAGGAMAPLDFGRSVTPISTKGGGTDYAHYITTVPAHRFLPSPTALELIRVVIGKGEGYTGPESTAHDEEKTFIKPNLLPIYLYLNFEGL